MQGEAVGAEALTALMGACLAAGAWDLALQLCNAALFAEVGRPRPRDRESGNQLEWQRLWGRKCGMRLQ